MMHYVAISVQKERNGGQMIMIGRDHYPLDTAKEILSDLRFIIEHEETIRRLKLL
jgi:hypothetical protein